MPARAEDPDWGTSATPGGPAGESPVGATWLDPAQLDYHRPTMPLLSGPLSVSRFRVVAAPEQPDFEQRAFYAIPPGSEVRESIGFVAMVPGAPWEVGHQRYAFRVRQDRLRPDPTLVRERVAELVAVELEQSAEGFVSGKKRRRLKALAEDELLAAANPTSRIVEGCLDGDLLYLATAAKTMVGRCLELLRAIGVQVEPATPWKEGEEPVDNEVLPSHEPGESILGARFLEALVGHQDIAYEPVTGSAKLVKDDLVITLRGELLSELMRLVDGGAEVVAAKLLMGETVLRLDALSWRLSGLRLEVGRHGHWTERLDERIVGLDQVFAALDGKFGELVRRRAATPVTTATGVSDG